MGSHVNKSGAENVQGTVVLVLERLMELLRQDYPLSRVVYDAKLTYASAVAQARKNATADDTPTGGKQPLIAFRRSPLRHGKDGPSKRLSTMNVGKQVSATKSRVLRSAWAETEVEFLFIARRLGDAENFEVAALAEENFTGTAKLDVSVADLGSKSARTTPTPTSRSRARSSCWAPTSFS
jgi:hypothetical protein